MKRILRLSVLFLAVLTVSACQKDNSNRLIIEAEGMNGSKLAIDGNSSYWAAGDQVRINGTAYDVNISAGQASVDLGNNPLSAPFYGVYPASIYGSNNGTSYTLNLLDVYTFERCNDPDGINARRQNLQSPMVAYKDANSSGNTLFFKHLTGAITVEVTNNFGFSVNVTGITVSSNLYQLSGSRTFDITNVEGISAATTNNGADKQVQMTFLGQGEDIASGATMAFQIPVLPVGNDNRFTISVTVRNADLNKTYTFTKTQAGNSSDGYALARAQIGYAPAKFGGVFSVGVNSVVRFSPGNLQYHAPTSEAPNGTWRFAENQYDIIGSDNENISSIYDGWIDLFGWGTSGWNNDGNFSSRHYQPYSFANGEGASALYGPAGACSLIGDYQECDWGIENSISNGGRATGLWRTLTGAEWQYLFFERTDHSDRLGKGKVGEVYGLIILPDEFTDPKLNSVSSDGTFAPVSNAPSSYSNSYTAQNWVKMEAAGAIFLPEEAYRNGTVLGESTTGHYWSSTHNSTNKAMAAQFHVNGIYIGERYRADGCSVRLVRVNEYND